MAGLAIIGVVALVAILGPFIRPDGTPQANHQHITIANKPPGFSVEMAREPRPEVEVYSAFERWINYGAPLAFRETPIRGYDTTGFALNYTTFDGIQVESNLPIDQAEIVRKRFLLGTDKFGRDLLSRLMAGSLISLAVGLIAVLISLVIGVALGALAGYFGGWVDRVVSWCINVVWSIPTLLLVLAMVFAFGKGFDKVFIAVGLTMWVEVARIVRGQVMALRKREFVQAAQVLGYSHFRIIRRHILPSTWGPVIVISAANFASAILIEAGLSFLGIGAQVPTPSWGNMIKEHYAYITTDMAYLAFIPGLAIMALVLAFMWVGNGLRDALDVR